ncbi:hypothetical protein CEXT_191751 [Caerostris extrusa]|uniref:Uncharacterized protein n=1 Tax=Caerostris extrusa TaxID=172846 RepID=A0AAV4NEG7_CAEEX|nr:hypothetical protein CEXT_191751 [Caerostris extrusa]
MQTLNCLKPFLPFHSMHQKEEEALAKLKPSQTEVSGFLVEWGDVSPLSVLKLATGAVSHTSSGTRWLIRIQRIALLAAVDKHFVRPLSRMSHNSEEVERVDVQTKQILQSLSRKGIFRRYGILDIFTQFFYAFTLNTEILLNPFQALYSIHQEKEDSSSQAKQVWHLSHGTGRRFFIISSRIGDWSCHHASSGHEVRFLLIRIQGIILLAAADLHSVGPLSRMSHNSYEVEGVDILDETNIVVLSRACV